MPEINAMTIPMTNPIPPTDSPESAQPRVAGPGSPAARVRGGSVRVLRSRWGAVRSDATPRRLNQRSGREHRADAEARRRSLSATSTSGGCGTLLRRCGPSLRGCRRSASRVGSRSSPGRFGSTNPNSRAAGTSFAQSLPQLPRPIESTPSPPRSRSSPACSTRSALHPWNSSITSWSPRTSSHSPRRCYRRQPWGGAA